MQGCDLSFGDPLEKREAISSGGTVSFFERSGTLYKLHTFTEDGTFKLWNHPDHPHGMWDDTAVLIVGGGGQGGDCRDAERLRMAAGGGGGAVFYNGSFRLRGNCTAGWAVVVGAGGSGATFGAGNPGGDSSLQGFPVALGGGGGAVSMAAAAGDTVRAPVVRVQVGRGSGGGGLRETIASRSALPATPMVAGGVQRGFAGHASGGGGGAGMPATDEKGAPGFMCDITGSFEYYGGGGGLSQTVMGGGLVLATGGLGGGGNAGQSGTAGTGGGGGGGTASASGNGGSGIVVIRLKMGPVAEWPEPIHWSDSDISFGGTVSRLVNNGLVYKLHRFNSSGTLVLGEHPTNPGGGWPGTVVLVVGGGGGGGARDPSFTWPSGSISRYWYLGGGGGGSVKQLSYASPVTPGDITITVGAGGSAGSNGGLTRVQGGGMDYSANGGGRGGRVATYTNPNFVYTRRLNGASGGGGGGGYLQSGTHGSGADTAFAGHRDGGGGGAGAAAEFGNGGNGRSVNITFSNVIYGGGGGRRIESYGSGTTVIGGTANSTGVHGGGNGNSNGSENTGGGGGGVRAGGSGLAMVRLLLGPVEDWPE